MSYDIRGFDVIDGAQYTKESKRLSKKFKSLEQDVKTNDIDTFVKTMQF